MSTQQQTKPAFWQPAPPPATKLGRYRQLAPIAGVHVSPICLGAMSIGDKWEQYGMGAMNKESSFKLLDAFYAAGGNFIDTANNYQDGSSEEFIGEWMEVRGLRDQMVIATKVGDYPLCLRTVAHYAPSTIRSIQATGSAAKACRRRRATSAIT